MRQPARRGFWGRTPSCLDGFEVDIIRRDRAGDDPHPIKLSDEDEDFWFVQARRANVLGGL